jgi:hypothetical protein
MPRMYTNIRRKAKDDIDLQSLTITLPQDVIVDLANHGIESGRGGGNLSNYLEIAALVTLGMFYDVDLAHTHLMRLVRNDAATKQVLAELKNNVEQLANQIYTMIGD